MTTSAEGPDGMGDDAAPRDELESQSAFRLSDIFDAFYGGPRRGSHG